MATSAPFINAYDRSDPLQAPLASMEDLSVIATPMVSTPLDTTPGASPRSSRARWSRSSLGSQLDPLIEDVVAGHPEPRQFREVRDMIDDEVMGEPTMTSTPVKPKHLFQKNKQHHPGDGGRRFASPSRLQNNLLRKRQQQQQQHSAPPPPLPACSHIPPQQSLFPHNYSDMPPPSYHLCDPGGPYDQRPQFRTCEPIQECPVEEAKEPSPPPPSLPLSLPPPTSSRVSNKRLWRKSSDLYSLSEEGEDFPEEAVRILDPDKDSDALLRPGSSLQHVQVVGPGRKASSLRSYSHNDGLVRNAGTEREPSLAASSLTGIGTNSSIAGFVGIRRPNSKGYRVGPVEEFVFPGGIPRDRFELDR